MRGVIWLVLLFVVAVVAATTLGSNDGLVTVYWGGWRTDLSLNLFVLLVVGSCVVIVLAAQTINSLITLPKRAGDWRALRRERAAQAALREALAEFFGARYGRARKAAQRALSIQADSLALQGDTDQRIAARLHISLDAVKQAWRGIVTAAAPFIPEARELSNGHLPHAVRGAERRRGVLEYLRQQMEELRPWPRAVRGRPSRDSSLAASR